MANPKGKPKPYLKVLPFPEELKKRCNLKAEVMNKDLREFVIENLTEAVRDLPELLRKEAARIEKEDEATAQRNRGKALSR